MSTDTPSQTEPRRYTQHTPECSYWKVNVCNCGYQDSSVTSANGQVCYKPNRLGESHA